MFEQKNKHTLISIGNDTFDRFLGGGFLHSSLNLFERQGPSSKPLNFVWEKSFSSSSLSNGTNLIVINFDTSTPLELNSFLSSIPVIKTVPYKVLYKDIQEKSAFADIKIAWRYPSRSFNADQILQVNQVDFRYLARLENIKLAETRLINMTENFSLQNFRQTLESVLADLKETTTNHTNILISNLLHPFSPLVDDPPQLLKFMYLLRCVARTLDMGAILVTYDIDMCKNHDIIKQNIYNSADSVVSFYSYETGQNIETGYKHTDGTLDYVKVPKINSFGPHFKRELTDWGYRFSKNGRYFIVEELSLPPCLDDEDEK